MATIRQALRTALAVAFLAGYMAPAGLCAEAGGIPLISDLVKKKNEKTAEKKTRKEVFPPALSVTEAGFEIIDILPGGSYFYLEMPSGEQLTGDYGGTAIAQLFEEKSVKTFLKENPLDLENLLQDLPEDYASANTVSLLHALRQQVEAFWDVPGTVAVAGYPGAQEEAILVFLADIGRVRKPAHTKLQELAAAIIKENPNLIHQQASHEGDYVESFRTEEMARNDGLAVGIVRNYMLLCSDPGFARKLVARAQGKNMNDSLAESSACRNLGAKTSPDSQLRGFVDLFAILESAVSRNMPEAAAALTMAKVFAQRSVFYYDLRVDGKGVYENLVIPSMGAAGTPTFASRFGIVTNREMEIDSAALHSPKLLPYNPDSFVAVRVKPGDLAALLKEEDFQNTDATDNLLGMQVHSGNMMQALKTVFGHLGDAVEEVIEGEIGFAMLSESGVGKGPAWTMTLPLRNTGLAVSAFQKSAIPPLKSGGIQIYTMGEELNEEDFAWAVFQQTNTTFKNLGYSFLVITSSGRWMERTIDSVIGQRATLATNEDFRAQIDQLKGRYAGVAYANLIKRVQTNYYNLPVLLRELFPQINSIRALPTLNAVTRHVFGQSSAFTTTDDKELRITFYSPMGVLPATVGELALLAPKLIRLKEEAQLMEARKNLSELNLALQEYATQYGHYPRAIHGETGRESIEPLLPEGLNYEILLSDPSASERLGTAEEAVRKSYTYVPGLLPSDVPETVILYNSAPYHYRYDELDDYTKGRLVLSLDGNIQGYSEENFRKHILPKIERRR